MRMLLFIVFVAVMVTLHHDFWLWTDKRLVFGFLPAGLAYHLGYSVLAACAMFALVKLAWPKDLDEDEPDAPSNGGERA
ncbi:MAG: DUF3311 domain-containing protein [Planctomycetes bacterium]|nr:DUF3311 domain-containing protein [Planctomycetota bacterium]